MVDMCREFGWRDHDNDQRIIFWGRAVDSGDIWLIGIFWPAAENRSGMHNHIFKHVSWIPETCLRIFIVGYTLTQGRTQTLLIGGGTKNKKKLTTFF